LREKTGGSIVRDLSWENMEVPIFSLDLIDVTPIKVTFTWNNRRAGPRHIATKLDHFLISGSFLSIPESLSSSIIHLAYLNHHHISLFFAKEENLGPIPFIFNTLWMEKPYLFPLVSRTWSQWISSSPVHIWEQNLKFTKVVINI